MMSNIPAILTFTQLHFPQKTTTFETSSTITKEERSRELPQVSARRKCAIISIRRHRNEYIGRRLIYLLRVYIKYCFVTTERARLSNQGGVNDRDQFVFCRFPAAIASGFLFLPLIPFYVCTCSSCNERTKPPCCIPYTESVCSKQHLNFTRRKKKVIYP